MPALDLGNGRTAVIEVRHGEKEVKKKFPPYRTTSVRITLKEGEVVRGEISGESVCSPGDQFDRGSGRYQALLRAFESDPQKCMVNREDRTKIFKIIVPKITDRMKAVGRSMRKKAAQSE